MPINTLLIADKERIKFFKRYSITGVDFVRIDEQLRNAQLLIIDKTSSIWDFQQPGFHYKFENGLHFIYDIRLKGYELPICILEPPANFPSDSNRWEEVYEDPLVCTISYQPNKPLVPQQILQSFQKIDDQERQLLFNDLRQTLYRKDGYLDELWHRVSRLLNNPDKEAIEHIKAIMKIAFKQTQEWCGRIDIGITPEECLNEIEYDRLKSWFEQLSTIVRSSKAVPRPEEKIQFVRVVYISDSEEQCKQLAQRFEDVQTLYPISCEAVACVEDIDESKYSNETTTVIVNFRFRNLTEKAGKKINEISTVNGYTIIHRLRKMYPQWQFIILTDFPVTENNSLPIPPDVEVFGKHRILNTGDRSFIWFALHILQYHKTASLRKDAWPKQLNNKDDSILSKYYAMLCKQDNFKEINQKINEDAINICVNILEQHLPPHNSSISQFYNNIQLDGYDKDQKMLDKLIDILLVRRVYLGLFQSCENKKEAMNIAYESKKEAHKQKILDDAYVSNYFTRIRLLTGNDYINFEMLYPDYITHAEYLWLAANKDDL